MKRTPLKRIGKRGVINIDANKKIRARFKREGITRCEIGLDSQCTGALFTGIAHRHKRSWYYNKTELLSDFNQTILACSHCHGKIEGNRKLTEEVFQALRGYES